MINSITPKPQAPSDIFERIDLNNEESQQPQELMEFDELF